MYQKEQCLHFSFGYQAVDGCSLIIFEPFKIVFLVPILDDICMNFNAFDSIDLSVQLSKLPIMALMESI